MLLIERELHRNCGLHVIDLFNILNTLSSLELIFGLEKLRMF
jgi:hypothetical protein